MFKIVDSRQRPVQFSRGQMREWKRNAKSQFYRAGGVALDADLTVFPAGAAAKIEAARAKRARKAAKRAGTAMDGTVMAVREVVR